MASKKRPASKSKKSGAIPEGFQPIAGYANSWDVEKQDELIGTWGEVREIEVPKTSRNDDGKRTVVTVTQDDGTPLTVWRSAGLAQLFEQANEGDRVFIRFDGMGKAKKGQNAPRLFTCAIDAQGGGKRKRR